MELANLYRNNIIYFPVRLDNRLRTYCMPTYLNYQSTELAKALILFSNPGLIYKNDEEAINLFKVAGASCYGLSKESYNQRVKWVNENVEDIINYNNGK